MSRTLLVGVVILAGITHATVSASEQGPAPPANGAQGIVPGVTVRVLPAPAPEKNPLITESVQVTLVEPFASIEPSAPEIICGMKVWRPDPSIDPGIYKPVPEGAADWKIRRIPATECVPGASASRHHVFQSGSFAKEYTIPSTPVRK